MNKLNNVISYTDFYNTTWTINGNMIDPFDENFVAPSQGDEVEISVDALQTYSGIKFPYRNYFVPEEFLITFYTVKENMTWMDLWLQIATRYSSPVQTQITQSN